MTLAHLNDLRISNGKAPLKSWKESKTKLAQHIHKETAEASKRAPVSTTRKAAPKPQPIAPVEDQSVVDKLISFGGTVQQLPVTDAALIRMSNRDQEIEKIVQRRMAGDTTALLPKPVVKKFTPPAPAVPRASRQIPQGQRSLAEICVEIGLSPKIARSKLRKVTIPADYMPSKYVFLAAHVAWVKHILLGK